MPIIPNVGEFTVCELHRDFLITTGDTDIAVEEAYSKILGRRYPSIPFLPRDSIPEPEAVEDEVHERTRLSENRGGGLLAATQLPILKQIFSRFTIRHNFDVLKKVELCEGVSWHKQRQCLAFVSGGHQVCVFDFEESLSVFF